MRAVMGTDGQIRIGFFVYSTAEGGQNDFTVSGLLSGDHARTVNFDNDGDSKPNGTLDMQRVNCSGVATSASYRTSDARAAHVVFQPSIAISNT